VFAHNLMLRKEPDFRIYVRWLRGQMVRTRRDVNPTFDDPESFFLEVKTGVIRANIGDIGNFLNRGGVAGSPLTNITLHADGDQIKLKGILHKLIPLPVGLLGSVAAKLQRQVPDECLSENRFIDLADAQPPPIRGCSQRLHSA
jgi:hypothetical protein